MWRDLITVIIIVAIFVGFALDRSGWIYIEHENVPHWVKRCRIPHAGHYILVNGRTYQYKIQGTFDGVPTVGWGEGVSYYKRLKK